MRLTTHPLGDPEGPFPSLSLSILICKVGTPGTHPHVGVRTSVIFTEYLLCARPFQEPGMNSPPATLPWGRGCCCPELQTGNRLQMEGEARPRPQLVAG